MSDLFTAETDEVLDGRFDLGLAYRVAPPVEDAYMPWVTILEPRRLRRPGARSVVRLP